MYNYADIIACTASSKHYNVRKTIQKEIGDGSCQVWSNLLKTNIRVVKRYNCKIHEYMKKKRRRRNKGENKTKMTNNDISQ